VAKPKNNAELQARLRSYEEKQKVSGQKAQKRAADTKLALTIAGGSVLLTLVATLIHGVAFPTPTSTASATTATGSSASPSASPSATATNSPLVPKPAVAENRTWTGTMKLNGSDLGLSLDGKAAPQAVANFITLAKKGFYNNVTCHRLTTAGIYVLQCGDPKGDGTGGPGYSFGPIENAPTGDLYKTGYLAMARQGGNGSSMGSQFFIVYKDSPIPSDAAGGYTVFGKITSGLNVVTAIAAKGSDNSNQPGDGHPKVATTIGSIKLN
jgi:peptidyl-prolyl cis-trans isomerase B (cyclophilin B)